MSRTINVCDQLQRYGDIKSEAMLMAIESLADVNDDMHSLREAGTSKILVRHAIACLMVLEKELDQ